MHKNLKGVFIGLITAFGILVLGLGILWIRGMHNESQTKQLLSQEIDTIPIPETCKESNRTYQNGGVDTNSAWFVNYSCATTIGVARDYISRNLNSRGFSEKDTANYSDFSRSIFTTDTYYVDYFFTRSLDKNDNQTPYTSDSPLQLLSVHIYRTGHTY